MVAMLQGHSHTVEAASERQTYSSMESLSSLTAEEGPESTHGPSDAQARRAPLGASPLGTSEGAAGGYAASRLSNGSLGYPQHLQGGLPGVPSLLQSIWGASPPWEASTQQPSQQASKPAQRQPGKQASAADLERVRSPHLASCCLLHGSQECWTLSPSSRVHLLLWNCAPYCCGCAQADMRMVACADPASGRAVRADLPNHQEADAGPGHGSGRLHI